MRRSGGPATSQRAFRSGEPDCAVWPRGCLNDDHTQPVQRKGFFGHPQALSSLFGLEMWERFSFYGMQSILTIYLYYSAVILTSRRITTGVLGRLDQPDLINLFAGGFAALWTKLGPRQPSTPVKFVLGSIGMGLAFLAFLPWVGGTGNTTPLPALPVSCFCSPSPNCCFPRSACSLSTKLAPENFRTQMVALDFLSVALGTGSLARLQRLMSGDH